MNERISNNPNGILWLVLSQDSQQKLREQYPPRYENEFFHHVTLAFEVPKLSVKEFIGYSAVVQAYAHATDASVQAVRVRTNPLDNLPDMYKVPHVTLSTAKDILPFAAVAMLRGEHSEAPISPTLELDGTVEFLEFDG